MKSSRHATDSGASEGRNRVSLVLATFLTLATVVPLFDFLPFALSSLGWVALIFVGWLAVSIVALAERGFREPKRVP